VLCSSTSTELAQGDPARAGDQAVLLVVAKHAAHQVVVLVVVTDIRKGKEAKEDRPLEYQAAKESEEDRLLEYQAAQESIRKGEAAKEDPTLWTIAAAHLNLVHLPDQAKTRLKEVLLKEHVKIVNDLLTIPQRELLELAETYANQLDGLIKLVNFKSKEKAGRHGRGMFGFHKGWECIPGLKEACPNLVAQLLIEQEYHESMVLMWSTGKAIGKHGDKRALNKATQKQLLALGFKLEELEALGGHRSYELKCIHGGGARPGMLITGRNVDGAPTQLFYDPTPHPVDNKSIVRGANLGPYLPKAEDVMCRFTRPAGTATFASMALHGGGVAYADDGHVMTLDWQADHRAKRILHGAYIEEGSYSIAILGSMREENMQPYLSALRRLPVVPTPVRSLPMRTNYFVPGNGFEEVLADCPASANADGCGGLPRDVHALRSVGGEQHLLAHAGQVYGDGSGGYTVASTADHALRSVGGSTADHALRCAAGKPQLCQSHPGLVYGDGSAGYTVATTEDHGQQISKGKLNRRADAEEELFKRLKADCPAHGWTVEHGTRASKVALSGQTTTAKYMHQHFRPQPIFGGSRAGLPHFSRSQLLRLLDMDVWKAYIGRKNKDHPQQLYGFARVVD